MSVGESSSVDTGVSEECGMRRLELLVRMYDELENQGARLFRIEWMVLRGASLGVVKAMV